MRVLVVHNRYSSRVPSGENLAVDDEVRWLGEAGVDVRLHVVTNDELLARGVAARVRDGLEAPWSPSARRLFERALDQHRPDVVHVHNLFPLLTASVPTAARQRGVPVTWTVHNRRVTCVAGGNFRDGRPCYECRPGWRLPGVAHRCYARSGCASALVTAASSLFRLVARRGGVTPIAISHDMARWLVTAAGFDQGSVRVKHNGVAPPGRPVAPAADQRAFVFLGRLAADKGVTLLLDAWRRADVDAELRIVGDGDLAGEVKAAAADDPRMTWVGSVPHDGVGVHLEAARAVIVPSLWNEPFGRVATEAFAFGRPVITTGRGALSEIVDGSTGWVTGDSPATMSAAIAEAASSNQTVGDRGAAARERHAAHFSPRATTGHLMTIYDEEVARPS
jgi:glycosyltransferase involved in cell wall biosynthesis